jgi:hypothetical protein
MPKVPTAPSRESAAKEIRIARAGCKEALDLLREMERQGGLRLPFPNHRETVKLLQAVLERSTPAILHATAPKKRK